MVSHEPDTHQVGTNDLSKETYRWKHCLKTDEHLEEISCKISYFQKIIDKNQPEENTYKSKLLNEQIVHVSIEEN